MYKVSPLTLKDTLGAWKVRWGIGRMTYTVKPGLYAMGQPDSHSPVLVSANYKLTFDILRKNLTGLDCWLLILDTKGVNVWCAAGKGTFGTGELIKRINMSELSEQVAHRQLILPQLGASGVSAHEIKKHTGFTVVYGPVRAEDIKAFIASGYKATGDMRAVRFNLADRLVLTPMELIPALKVTAPIAGALWLTNRFAARPFDKRDAAIGAGAVLTGTVLTPALLPVIPGKAFALKGWLLGMGWTVGSLYAFKRNKPEDRLLAAGYILLLPAMSAYFAMNFTGSSTYTSPSGVKKEMTKALPLITGAAVAGAALTLAAHVGTALLGRRKHV